MDINKKTKISLIAAIQKKDRGLGFKGKLLWRIPEDLKRFKELTLGHPVIIGQKTFKSIGPPLPGRTNIVLTLDAEYKAKGCVVCHSLEEAFKAAMEKDRQEIFVIGGGEIYRQTLPLANKLYLTVIEGEKPADAFFPDYSDFSISKSFGGGEQNGVVYEFLELTKPPQVD